MDYSKGHIIPTTENNQINSSNKIINLTKDDFKKGLSRTNKTRSRERDGTNQGGPLRNNLDIVRFSNQRFSQITPNKYNGQKNTRNQTVHQKNYDVGNNG